MSYKYKYKSSLFKVIKYFLIKKNVGSELVRSKPLTTYIVHISGLPDIR